MKTHLTSIAEHSDWLESLLFPDYRKWELHRKRVAFGKQPLEPWMFASCDEDGNVLEETTQFDPDETSQYYAQQMWDNKQYQQAKSRCFFEDFELENRFVTHKSHASFFYPISCLHERTIEDLVKYNLELTATAKKQIGL